MGPQAPNTDQPTCMTEAGILAEYPDLFEGTGLLPGDFQLEVDEAV